MELCSGKDLEVIQLHFPTKTKTIIARFLALVTTMVTKVDHGN